MVMGSNIAECHPVAFRWVMKSKEKGGKLIHVDPRFTRTTAMADHHAPIRAGTDIVFLGALINRLINDPAWLNSEFHQEYTRNYTNASAVVAADYKGADDGEGLFSGWSADRKTYDNKTWQYQRDAAPGAPTGDEKTYAEMLTARIPGQIKQDPTLQDPNSVFQMLRRHYARYTPEMVVNVCGCSRAQFDKTYQLLFENSGRERTGAFVYAVGWAQHTTGVQMIRAAGILQALLGNMGRPGGGILALRG
ncbi:MAG: molybdopterin-dependent oxidoreductase, partial [Thermoflexales bacterium]